ncbi:hypothetical protein bplSymb_SCF09601P001 [Bathymodiolus platifrons methanotrophic gill symbiont]|uniref:galactose-binding domain-containing protein n=1 Tax=Bathymodiolus platifrons methanotrophic gill symbiont TaxID=113268 RepID=UPI000B418067|nr:discoidin domain-containing protein [Bathymodiolus platifrons methanotrophic gill symbiont]GAW87507.1 hypothetical protein bplSymb_SCF09601P001 [Bathymodiolus platifrons methanotrophic gill symbiont]
MNTTYFSKSFNHALLLTAVFIVFFTTAHATSVNLALGKKTTQSSDYRSDMYHSEMAVNGYISSINGVNSWAAHNFTHTKKEFFAWWKVDLGSDKIIDTIIIYNREDCCRKRLTNYQVAILDDKNNLVYKKVFHGTFPNRKKIIEIDEIVDKKGRYVKVQLLDKNYLSLAEVQVMGRDVAPPVYMCDEAYNYSVYDGDGGIGPAGGFIFHINENGSHGMEAAPKNQGNAEWGCNDVAFKGAYVFGLGIGVGTGEQNTADILSAGCTSTEKGSSAAKIASDYEYGGYSDWFLPSKEELDLMFNNLQYKHNSGFSDTFWESYDKRGEDGNFWSSSANGKTKAWAQNFGHYWFGNEGMQYERNRRNKFVVRPIRYFKICP